MIAALRKECQHCGDEFTPKLAKKRFCSKKCGDLWRHHNPTGKVVECVGCGAEFVPKGSDRKKYCSRECAFKHRRGEKRNDVRIKRKQAWAIADGSLHWMRLSKRCEHCDIPFTGYASSKYCSERCSYSARHQPTTPLRSLLYVVRCVDCGKEWLLKHPRAKRCIVCARRHVNRKCEHRKRARRFGVEYVPVSVKTVFKRDGYRCGICGERTNPKAEPTDNSYPTLDHIVPLSKGGSHTYHNVQCACRGCNMRKGNKIGKVGALVVR